MSIAEPLTIFLTTCSIILFFPLGISLGMPDISKRIDSACQSVELEIPIKRGLLW